MIPDIEKRLTNARRNAIFGFFIFFIPMVLYAILHNFSDISTEAILLVFASASVFGLYNGFIGFCLPISKKAE